MKSHMDPREVARSRSKLYVEEHIERAQGVMKDEVASHSGWTRPAFEDGFLDAAQPLYAALDTADAQIDMLKEQLQQEREARFRAQEEALALKSFPMFVLFPLKSGGSTYVRLDQIAAITDSKVYLIGDDIPFTELKDPKKALDNLVSDVTQLLKNQHDSRVLVRKSDRPHKIQEPESPSVEIGAGAMNFGHD